MNARTFLILALAVLAAVPVAATVEPAFAQQAEGEGDAQGATQERAEEEEEEEEEPEC